VGVVFPKIKLITCQMNLRQDTYGITSFNDCANCD